MRYYISDCHFYHKNLLTTMDKRPFSSVEEMNETMIEKWNGKVRKNDEVIVLGDLSYGDGRETNEILSRLKGKLYLIRGNHDERFLKDSAFDASRFGWIKDYAELKDNKRKVILMHYPVFCYKGQYRLNDVGNPNYYMLHGHVHNTFDQVLIDRFIRETRESECIMAHSHAESKIPCQMINCFCMYSDYVPLTLDEWIVTDRERKEKTQDE